MTLRTRFILYFGFGGIAFLLVVTSLVFNRMEVAMIKQLKQQFEDSVSVQLDNLRREFHGLTTDFQSAAAQPLFRSMRYHQLTLNKAAEKNDIRHLELSFLEMINRRPEIMKVQYIDGNALERIRVDHSGIKRNLSDLSLDPAVSRALALSMAEYEISQTRHGEAMASLVWKVPVHISPTRNFGVLLFHVDYAHFANILRKLAASGFEHICLQDMAGGDAIFGNRNRCLAEASHDSNIQWEIDRPLLFPGLSWTVHFSEDSELILAPVGEVRILVFGVIFPFIALFFLAASILFSNDIVLRIRQLLQAAQAMGRGESLEPIDVKSDDELGQLAVEVNRSAKLIEEGRRKLEGDLDLVIESSNAAIVGLDRDGRFEDWNKGTEQITGYGKQDANRADFANTVLGEQGERDLKRLFLRVLRGEAVANSEMSIRSKTGDTLSLLFNWTPRMDREGRVVGITGVGQDITESKLVAEELKWALAEAESANEAKSQFLATMSHELRTPLNAILGFSEMIRMQPFGPLGSDRYLGYLDDIHSSGRHLLSLISDILFLTKIESESEELEKEKLVVTELIAESLKFVEIQAKDKGVIVTAGSCDDSRLLPGNRRSLVQSLINLLSNAVKFTPKGGAVVISCAVPSPEWLELNVTDTGIGIAPEDLDKLCQPFVQIERMKTGTIHEGAGLGLTITKKLVERHGGTLTFSSEPDVGTTATIRLPSA